MLVLLVKVAMGKALRSAGKAPRQGHDLAPRRGRGAPLKGRAEDSLDPADVEELEGQGAGTGRVGCGFRKL